MLDGYADRDLICLTLAKHTRFTVAQLIQHLRVHSQATTLHRTIVELALEGTITVTARGLVRLAHEPPHALPQGKHRRILTPRSRPQRSKV